MFNCVPLVAVTAVEDCCAACVRQPPCNTFSWCPTYGSYAGCAAPLLRLLRHLRGTVCSSPVGQPPLQLPMPTPRILI